MTTVVGEAAVRIRPDTTLFRAETQAGITGALGGLGRSGALTAGVLRGGLLAGGLTAGLTAFALGAREAVGGAADLEQQLDLLQTVGQATDEQMEQISEEAKRLGADLTLPGISAADSAAAMLELVKGGLSVNETLAGTKGTLQLATAANIAFADSAQIVARALTTFEEPGSEAARVADLLAGAANAATGEIPDMALALSQVGAVAHQAGIGLDDTVTAISLLARNGLIGSDAGTSLRTTLLRLLPQSKEAAEVVRALGIETADAAGNIRPLRDIFEDYRVALSRLTPELQQAALTQIFGTDAIRAAAIFANEGAEGFDAMAERVTREGQAAETAAARTEGLRGSIGNLGSQAETLATNLGEIAVPAVTKFVDVLAGGVGAINSTVQALEDLNDIELPVLGDLGDNFWEPIIRGAERGSGAIEKINLFGSGPDPRALIVAAENTGSEAGIAFAEGFNFSAAVALTGGAPTSISEGLIAKETIEARQAGEQLGRQVGTGIADGVISAEQEAVNAARRTLREVLAAGREAVQEAIRQGNEAVRLSAVDARSNLISIGQELASDALRLLEEGPLARRIQALRASLDRAQAGNERRRLTQDVRDAERALADAQRQLFVAGPLTPLQRLGNQRFLEPFQRDVVDAKAALSEFSTESVIGRLEEQAETQKRVVQQGIADLIVEFNKGALSLSDLNVRIADLLRRNGVEPFGAAGKRLGSAFREEWLAEFRGMLKQAAEIAKGFDVPQIGVEPTIVSPTGERRRQNENVAQTQEQVAASERSARQALIRAQNDLRRSNEELSDPASGVPALVAAIKANTKALGGGKRPTAAQQPGSSGDRSAGRTP